MVAQASRARGRACRRQGRARPRSRRSPWPRRGGSRSGRCRRGVSDSSPRMPSTASASSPVTNGGMARSKITASPGSSTRQPMMPSVSGHNFSPAPRSSARPSPSVDSTAAAAPSPNKAVATIAAGSSLSRRIEIEQVSTRDEQPVAAGLGGGEARGGGEPGHAAGAAQPEHRHAARRRGAGRARARRARRCWAWKCRWSRRTPPRRSGRA